MKENKEYNRYNECLEKNIQKAILDYLAYRKDVYWFRSNSFSGKIQRANGSEGYIKNNKPGCPDITVLFQGRYIAVEVKGLKGKQKPEQKEAEQQIKKCGGEYHIVRSVDEVINILKKL